MQDVVAPEELESTGVVVTHSQVSATFQPHIVGSIFTKQAVHHGGLVNADIEIHAQVAGHGAFRFLYVQGITEITELHQVGHLVLYRDGRVQQNIGDICIAQHAQFAIHVEPADASLDSGIQVDIDLAVGSCFPAALCIDEFKVRCLGIDLQGDVREVPKVYGTVQCEGRRPLGMSHQTVQGEAVVRDDDTVILHRHVETVKRREQVQRVVADDAIDDRLRRTAAHLHLSVQISGQLEGLVQEGIGQRHGETLQAGIGIYLVCGSLVGVLTAETQHLMVILHQQTIDEMRAILVGHVGGIQVDVSHGIALIVHVAHGEVGHDTVHALRLGVADITMQQTCDIGDVWHHVAEFTDIEMVERGREVLLCLFVGGGIEFQTCSVIGHQVEIGIHTAVLEEFHIVVWIDRKMAEGQDGTIGSEVYPKAFGTKSQGGPEVNTFPSLLIKEEERQ